MKLSITKVAAIAFMLVAGSAISTAANAQSTTASAGLNPVTLYKANSAKSFATLYPIDGTGYAGEGAYAVFDFTPSAAISGPVTGVSLSLFDEDYGNDAAGLLDVYVTSDETDATNSSPTGPLVTVPSGLVGNTTIPTTAFSNLDFLGQFNWTKTAAEGTEETETLTGADSNALTDITDGSAYSLVLSPWVLPNSTILSASRG